MCLLAALCKCWMHFCYQIIRVQKGDLKDGAILDTPIFEGLLPNPNESHLSGSLRFSQRKSLMYCYIQ